MSKKHWKMVINSNSSNSIRNLIDYLVKTEFLIIGQLRKKRHRTHKYANNIGKKEEQAKNCDHIFYGLGHNTIFLRKNDISIKMHHDWCALREFVIGRPLVVDFSFAQQIKSQKAIKSLMREAALAIKVLCTSCSDVLDLNLSIAARLTERRGRPMLSTSRV